MYVTIERATANATTPCRTPVGFCPLPADCWSGDVASGALDAIVLHHIRASVLTEFEALEANLRQSFRILAEGRPQAGIAELDGVSIASLGARFQMFNAAFLHRRVVSRDDLERRLDSARGFFDSQRTPWAFWVCEEWLAWPARRVLAGLCENFGMQAVAEMPGMVADALRGSGGFLQKSRPAAVLDIRR